MKYIFTTLSIGESYFNTSLETFNRMLSKCNADFNITTNITECTTDKINLDILNLEKYSENNDYFGFYFNLKSLSLKSCLDKGYDYVVYLDSDWKESEGFSEEKFLKLFEHMEFNNLDFLFERPGRVGDHKKNLDYCFFREKLNDYHVFEHDKWDDAHVPNEQFMVFKNNDKFRFFVSRWEQFLWYSIKNNIKNYAEGFEIGVSSLEAKMNWDWDSFRGILTECFEFHDKLGNLHKRF
jgi:hypothetical protein